MTKKLSQRAHRAVVLADADDCWLVVLHTDADAPVRKQNPPASYIKRRDLMQAGVDAAGRDRPTAVLAVPTATTEAWALGDASCVKDRATTTDTALLRRSPELLWGKPNDPDSNHPKCVLERLLGTRAPAAVPAELAEAMDLDEARARCPHSLEPFLAALEAA